MTPKPYNKYYALKKYCIEKEYSHSELIYIGDDYGLGGNDEAVYQSDIEFIDIAENTREFIHEMNRQDNYD